MYFVLQSGYVVGRNLSGWGHPRRTSFLLLVIAYLLVTGIHRRPVDNDTDLFMLFYDNKKTLKRIQERYCALRNACGEAGLTRSVGCISYFTHYVLHMSSRTNNI